MKYHGRNDKPQKIIVVCTSLKAKPSTKVMKISRRKSSGYKKMKNEQTVSTFRLEARDVDGKTVRILFEPVEQ